MVREKERENDAIRNYFDSEITKTKQLFVKETLRARREERGISENLEREVEERAMVIMDEKAKTIHEHNVILRAQLEEFQQQIIETGSEKDRLQNENKNLSRTVEMNKDLLKEYTKQCFVLSKELRNMNQKYDTEKAVTDIERKYKDERKLLKGKYETQIVDLERKKDELTKLLQLRNRELSHLRKIGKKLLEQRTELEMFFTEAMGYVKGQLKAQNNVVSYKPQSNDEAVPAAGSVLPPIAKVQQPQSTDPTVSPSNSFTSLPWSEKEKVLRILFDKINGVPMKQQQQESAESSKKQVSMNQSFKLNTSLSNVFTRNNSPSTESTTFGIEANDSSASGVNSQR